MAREPVCENCGSKGQKVLYAGFPMFLCSRETCSTVWGRFARVTELMPFDGWFMRYDGPYLGALWYWLTNDPEVE
jgi:hypothetical protein